MMDIKNKNDADKLRLVPPTHEHKTAALEFRQEYFDCGETVIHGDSGLDTANSYEEWLEKCAKYANHTFTEETVPSTVYFGMQNGKIVGILQIRHKLNQFLSKTYGHIGYGVRPSERRQGFATKMLGLALDICRELEIAEVLISCDKSNIASAKTIINNGGVLQAEIAEANGNNLMQYILKL